MLPFQKDIAKPWRIVWKIPPKMRFLAPNIFNDRFLKYLDSTAIKQNHVQKFSDNQFKNGKESWLGK